MTFQPRFTFGPETFAVDAKAGLSPSDRKLLPLHEELALMDTIIPLTLVPELQDNGDENADLVGFNLFSAQEDDTSDDDSGAAPGIALRAPRRNKMAQSRLVALRRRAMRSQLRRPLPAWPLPGGQNEADLRDMRARIYSPDPAALNAEEKPSVPLRLATHAISLSLVATALPVGAAVLTYNLLKGEDIKVTARLTTLTGLALAVLAGNPHLAQAIGA